jgi:outer membrane biosynthesis protein TonB
MKKIILSSRELIAAKLPKKPVTYLGEPLKISKSKDPYTMYVQYDNPGNLLSPTAEWKVLVEIGYKAKGSKAWKTKHATIEGAPGQLWKDDSKGSLAKALADVNADLGNVIDQNTMNDYSRIIAQDAVPTVEIKQYIDDNRAWTADKKQRKNQINQQKQQQTQQKTQNPKAQNPKAAPNAAPNAAGAPGNNTTQLIDDDDDNSVGTTYSPRKAKTWGQMLATKNFQAEVNQDPAKTNMQNNDNLDPDQEYVLKGKETDAMGKEYLLFEGPDNRKICVTKDGAKALFRMNRDNQDIDVKKEMQDGYNNYKQSRESVIKAYPGDDKKVFKTIGDSMYTIFIPYKIVNNIPLDPDEWFAISKGAVTIDRPYFKPLLKDKSSLQTGLNLLLNFRTNVAKGVAPTNDEEKALMAFNLHEIFEDVWNYLKEGGKQKLQQQPKKNTAPVPTAKGAPTPTPTTGPTPTPTPTVKTSPKAKPTPTAPGQKINVQATLTDEDIINKFSDIIFKENK